MQQEYEFYETARAIVSFTDSYTQNKQGKQNEQPESESIPSITKICSSLQFLRNQILSNNTCKQVIQIPKLLKSITTLSQYKIGIHIGQELDQMRLEIRCNSRWCLFWIQVWGDEQDQSELINKRYGRVTSISFCTAGGVGEEQDDEIYNGLRSIYLFISELHEGRNNDYKPSFQSLPLLARRSEEQMEEEGANEEIEAQMNNNGYVGDIKNWANRVKAMILNRFIYKR
ncbi:MAG: hypothetical protein EZS28_038105 [Streblomastix strix]|uniref:Uncharacterized protein n=1 Tax=Streblomastix strix TaxID=222440 RepID=A0A5J4U7T1_9EUKA|nr:MAG: hypothetical protein EZS28_038105 [Streblomastix strix]